MYDQPDEWYDKVRGSHTMVESVEVLDEDGSVLRELIPSGGEITEAYDAEIRCTGSVNVVDQTGELTPTDLDDLLMPVGRRVRVSRGIVDAVGDMIPLTTAFLTRSRARLDEEGRAAIPLTLLDRAVRLQRPTTKPLALAAGRLYPSTIRAALLTVDPTTDVDLMASDATSPRFLFNADTNMWNEAIDMAAVIDGDLYISREDTLTLRPIPTATPNTPVVWRFTEEQDPPPLTSTAMNAEAAADTYKIPNGIVVIGQHSSMPHPVRGEAWDERPTSPTYRYGPYGEYAETVTTEKATTPAMAAAMARAILQTVNFATEVNFEVFPPPFHLVTGDIVELDLPSVGAAGRYILWQMVTPVAQPDGKAQITVRRSVTEDF